MATKAEWFRKEAKAYAESAEAIEAVARRAEQRAAEAPYDDQARLQARAAEERQRANTAHEQARRTFDRAYAAEGRLLPE
jgi:hypothetical protein